MCDDGEKWGDDDPRWDEVIEITGDYPDEEDIVLDDDGGRWLISTLPEDGMVVIQPPGADRPTLATAGEALLVARLLLKAADEVRGVATYRPDVFADPRAN